MTIENLPPLKDIIAAHDLRAKKALGQNFLLDINVTDKIVRAAGDFNDTTVFEIGPGPGGLTRSLLKSNAKKVIAVEFDNRAVNALQSLVDASEGRLQVIQADALNTDLLTFAPKDDKKAIVANLPYNIATPLLIGWLKQIRENKDCFSSMTLMFQKEVAQRIVASCGDKAYGRLAVLSNWLCDTKKLFDLPPSVFTPPPKIHSSIVHLTPKALPENPPVFSAIEDITAKAFGQRRKMVRSSLKPYVSLFEEAGIAPEKRAEDLSVESYIKLARLKAE